MVKESRVLQWYIDCYGSINDFNKLSDKEKFELTADTLFYTCQVISTLKNEILLLNNKLTQLPKSANVTTT